jgi:hypothetical protein
MSKFDSLLKRVEVFEKLAEHGDRKTFLQSLSQMYQGPSLSGPPMPAPGTPLSEKLTGKKPQPASRYIELEPGEGEGGPTAPAAAPTAPASTTAPLPPPAPSMSAKPPPAPGSPGTPGGRPLTLSEKLKGPPYPTK